jgi:pseudouridine synthase
MRVQRALARAGVSSRRDADAMIAAGRVTVNGEVATVGQTVDPARDRIALDGAPVAAPAPRAWIVLHKPPGVLTTRDDPEGRPTVFGLVPDRPGLTYVGRLDYMTEGVLLFTTDGDAAHQLTHPSRGVERTYVAVVRGNAPAAVRELRRGVMLDDGPVTAEQVDARPLGNRTWEFELTITEGRTREVRRVCEALDLEVLRLVRTRFGPVRLGNLPAGHTRALNGAERAVLDTLTGVGTTASRAGRARAAAVAARVGGAGREPGAGARVSGASRGRGDRPEPGARGAPRRD